MEKKQSSVEQVFSHIKASRNHIQYWNDSMLVDWLLEQEDRLKAMQKEEMNNYLIQEQTPIELPTDDEIDDEATHYIENASAYSFRMGAKWMRDKIQGGDND